MADGITFYESRPEGSGWKHVGKFIHTVGAAECTFKLGAGRVMGCEVVNLDSGAKCEPQGGNIISESVSGSTNTVTVHILDTVADGRITVTTKS